MPYRQRKPRPRPGFSLLPSRSQAAAAHTGRRACAPRQAPRDLIARSRRPARTR
ncbi:hypothetical protein [Lysobacter gummosus]|uniref:hypothetical protein n=1 Tax=Lysobacter gummosus TaxID=262324 RepID=UPI00363A751D